MSPQRSSARGVSRRLDAVGLTGEEAVDPVGNQSASAVDPSGEQEVAQTWPQGVSRTANLRISDVLVALQPEFPAVTHSKLRFLEEQGLISPVRTPSGYRQYSLADVERLRYVLAQQRDKYLPLRVIREDLAQKDADSALAPVELRVATQDGERILPEHARRGSLGDLATAADAPLDLVEQLADLGFVRTENNGQVGLEDSVMVRSMVTLGEYGIEPRHLRTLLAAVNRERDLIERAVIPLKSRKAASSAGHAALASAELGELLNTVHAVLLRHAVAELEC